jgi:hypothetical protein
LIGKFQIFLARLGAVFRPLDFIHNTAMTVAAISEPIFAAFSARVHGTLHAAPDTADEYGYSSA